tara:strand:- start:30248 stop:30721 length:474 start_codon:yes stop_codon:yes gene_type:complete
MHGLQEPWTLYLHFSNDTEWDDNSYKKICVITYVEEGIALFELLTNELFKSVMFFLMRGNIKPMWEVDENKNGGAFSFKVDMDNIKSIWTNMSYQCIGETLINSDDIQIVNGITFSPKKCFGILKIWTSDCSIQNPSAINYFPGLSDEGCIFKKHIN